MSNPNLYNLNAPVVFVPVRHHSPACARMVRELITTLRPTAILIEGPADFNERLDELLLPHQLPIAIYSYVQLEGGPRRGAFYPFCEHSPEWEALQAGYALGIPLRFIDLPWAELAAADAPIQRYADGELRTSPYLPTLYEKLGVEDFDALWDLLVEIEPDLSAGEIFRRVQQFCFHLRAAEPRIRLDDLRRESFMLAQIRAAHQEFGAQVLVITGGFHSSALCDGWYAEPVALAASKPPPISERGIALTPYTDQRLDGLSGYEAGMPSPGFYRRIFRDRRDGRGASYRSILAEVVVTLRKRGQIASTADIIAVETSARALAALRGHAEIWRRDLIDAIIGALVKEAIEPNTRHPFLEVLLEVLRGNERGSLAAGVQLPPLVQDLRRQYAAHDLTPATQERRLRLDLSEPADLARSRILHRIQSLGMSGFVRTGGSDFVTRSDLAQIWEQWKIVWTPEQEAAAIEAAIYGATLEDAATARVLERAAQIERSAEQAALVLLDACLMGLHAHVDVLFVRLTELVRSESDFLAVGAALDHLLYLYRYDEFLGAAGRSDIGALLVETFRRALWLLESLGHPQGEDRALLRSVRALLHTYEHCADRLALDRAVLSDVLRRVAADSGQRPLLRGAAGGALWALGTVDNEQVQADLLANAAPEQLGDFLTGLFALARETAQRHPELVRSIDQLLTGYDDEAFLHALPALRLAFTFFTPREKHYMVQTLLNADELHPLPELEVDVDTAARAMGLESWLLNTCERYGIKVGTA